MYIIFSKSALSTHKAIKSTLQRYVFLLNFANQTKKILFASAKNIIPNPSPQINFWFFTPNFHIGLHGILYYRKTHLIGNEIDDIASTPSHPGMKTTMVYRQKIETRA